MWKKKVAGRNISEKYDVITFKPLSQGSEKNIVRAFAFLNRSPKGGQKTNHSTKEVTALHLFVWPGWAADGRIIWCVGAQGRVRFYLCPVSFKFQTLLVEFSSKSRLLLHYWRSIQKLWLLTLLAELFYIMSKSTLEQYLSVPFYFINAQARLELNTMEASVKYLWRLVISYISPAYVITVYPVNTC